VYEVPMGAQVVIDKEATKQIAMVEEGHNLILNNMMGSVTENL